MALIALLGFGLVVLFTVLLLHGYLWWRLVRGTTRPGRLRRGLTLLTAVLAVLPILAVLLRGRLSRSAAAPLDWAGYTWLGLVLHLFLAYLFLAVLVTEPVLLVIVETRAWLRHLPTLGVDVLRNERVSIRRGGATLDLAGIDDRTAAGSGVPGHGADLAAALDGRDDDVPVVLLAHQPVPVEQARAAGVDLQLSGHTHGGRLWSVDYAVLLDQPVVEGCPSRDPPSSTSPPAPATGVRPCGSAPVRRSPSSTCSRDGRSRSPGGVRTGRAAGSGRRARFRRVTDALRGVPKGRDDVWGQP